jgi:hypothetical protein
MYYAKVMMAGSQRNWQMQPITSSSPMTQARALHPPLVDLGIAEAGPL